MPAGSSTSTSTCGRRSCLEALRPPRPRRRPRGWTLHLAGEPPFAVDPADHDPPRGPAGDAGIGPRCSLVAVQPAGHRGAARRQQAQPLLDAWHGGVAALPPPFGGLGRPWPARPRPRRRCGPAARPAFGRPAGRRPTALGDPAGVEASAPVLAAAARRRPAGVRPPRAGAAPLPDAARPGGRRSSTTPRSCTPPGGPGTSPVAPCCPSLRVCFAAGAGLAPVHHERFSARGGGAFSSIRNAFVDTSSYGRQGVDALVRALGIDADRPRQRPALRRRRTDPAGRRRPARDPRHQPAPTARRSRCMTETLTATHAPSTASAGWTVPACPDVHRARAGLSTLAGPRPGQAELLRAGRRRSPPTRSCGSSTSPSATRSGTTSRSTATRTSTSGCCAGPRQNDTGWHDHDISSGAVAVVEGSLTEHNLAVGAAEPVAPTSPAGRCYCFGPDHIHRLTGRDAGQRLDPRLLAAAVADGPVRGRRDRRPAPDLGLLRRRAAPARRHV